MPITGSVDADVLLLLTDVDAVQGRLRHAARPPDPPRDCGELRSRGFPGGSMGPKVEAARRFVAATGRIAVIGRLDDAEAMAHGKAGMVVTP